MITLILDPAYRKPTGKFIQLDQTTKALFDIEARRADVIRASARELGKVLGFPDRKEFFTHALPETLLAVLNSYDPQCSALAAITFLEKHGFEVVKRGEQNDG